MKSKTKRKLVFAVCSLSLIVVFIGVTIAVVLAAMQQSVSTSINVSYISKEVAGVVSATYKVKNGQEISMLNEQGGTTLEFDGSEGTTDGGSLSPDGDDIKLTSTNNNVVFKYSFTNTGDADYVATVSQTNTLDNLIMEISKDGVNYTSIKDYYMTVFGRTLTPQDYYVRFTIENVAKNVDANIAFKWDLKSVPRDTVAVANGVAYDSLDDAIAYANSAPSTFTATNVSAEDNNSYGIVGVISNTTLYQETILNKNIIIYAEKDVEIMAIGSTLFTLGGNILNLGMPYNTHGIKYNCSGTLVSGAGELNLNAGIINDQSGKTNTAISLTGASSRVNLNGGKIENFAIGINIENGSLLSIEGGSIENCEQSFAGTGSLLIDSNEEVKISDTSFSGMSLTIEKGTVTLDNVIMSEFTGSALIINGGSVTLTGCTVEKCNNTAIKIKNGSTILINNTTIKDNNANLGGGIFNEGDLTIDGTSLMTNNIASNNGGAIYNVGKLKINNGTFTKNSATTVGGFISNAALGELIINGGNYNENTASDGGAIYNVDTITINGGTFYKNTASEHGGTIFSEVNLVMSGGEIDGGNTDGEKIVNAKYGGAIFMSRNNYALEISETATIKNCYSSEQGGAIYSKAVVIINYVDINNCSSAVHGGAFALEGNITIHDGKFENCKAASFGGVIFNSSTNENTMTISGGVFDGGNISDTTIENATHGGAIFVVNQNVSTIFNGATLRNFYSTSQGGLIYSAGKISMTSGTIERCKSVTHGGAIFAEKEVSITGGIIDGGSSKDNIIVNAEYGGIIFNNSTTAITELGGTAEIKNFIASEDGCLIYTKNGVNITGGIIDGGNISDVEINYYVGIITTNFFNFSDGIIRNCVIGDGSVFDVKNTSNISATKSVMSGGTIQNCMRGTEISNGRDLIITGGIIDECRATDGGAIHVTDNGSSLEINGDVIIKNCIATSRGGAIYCSGALNLIKGTIDGGNTSESAIVNAQNGGAIYINRDSVEVNIYSQFTIKNMRVSSNGGAIYNNYLGSNLSVTIENCVAVENGGAIYISSYVKINNINIKSCNANQGGAIYNFGGSVYIQSGIIQNCEAKDLGGAIFSSGLVVFDLGEISDCMSNNLGGAIYSSGYLLEMNGGKIKNCSTTNLGGAICLGETSKIAINSGEIIGCSANIGGAIYCASTNENNVINANFVANTATEYGGSISFYDGAIASVNSNFSNYDGEGTLLYSGNNAKFGGAIYISDGCSLTVTGGSYSGLKASKSGGAITNLGTLNITGAESVVVFDGCSSKLGGAIANSAYNSGSIISIKLVGATLSIKNVEFKNNTSVEGEGNAIVNIGTLTIGENITQATSNQDICIGKLTVVTKSITGSIVNDGITTTNISLSFAKASLQSITDFSEIELDTSVGKDSFTYDIDNIPFTEYVA